MENKTFLSQWVNQETPAAQGSAKQHEFSVYVPPLLDTLAMIGAKNIIDFQADEGVISVAFCAQAPDNHATFVPPSAEDDLGGTFRKMAEDITKSARENGQVTLTASAADINDGMADAILFNNILGCQGCVENVDLILEQAERLVKKGGHALVTVPNPDGGVFSSYTCTNLPSDKKHGGTYDFQMRGEEDVFKNLYLTKEGLTEMFAKHGFNLVSEKEIADKPYQSLQSEQPAFRQYLFMKPA